MIIRNGVATGVTYVPSDEVLDGTSVKFTMDETAIGCALNVPYSVEDNDEITIFGAGSKRKFTVYAGYNETKKIVLLRQGAYDIIVGVLGTFVSAITALALASSGTRYDHYNGIFSFLLLIAMIAFTFRSGYSVMKGRKAAGLLDDLLRKRDRSDATNR